MMEWNIYKNYVLNQLSKTAQEFFWIISLLVLTKTLTNLNNLCLLIFLLKGKKVLPDWLSFLFYVATDAPVFFKKKIFMLQFSNHA